MIDCEFLATTLLFEGATPQEIESMIGCLDTHIRVYTNGERFWHMGDRTTNIGLVLDGAARIESVDAWGNVSVMGHVKPGQLFGEAYAASGEKRTLELMVGIYCRGNHGGATELCPSCRELVDYAFKRIDACPFMEDKTFCSACEVHCYRPDMRERIRDVMRYAGPRMMLHDPVGAIRHLMYGRPKKR